MLSSSVPLPLSDVAATSAYGLETGYALAILVPAATHSTHRIATPACASAFPHDHQGFLSLLLIGLFLRFFFSVVDTYVIDSIPTIGGKVLRRNGGS